MENIAWHLKIYAETCMKQMIRCPKLNLSISVGSRWIKFEDDFSYITGMHSHDRAFGSADERLR